ncbi:Eukaryotic translation initiation factor 3 subunit K [Aphelenchoides bicaudatus]|nr:Eukaryotic translation initiation factor 3 subunit K [Aphelenchoides bicaudatus]
MSFDKLKAELEETIKGVNRYNPNHIPKLQECITAMIRENNYSKDVLLTTLKLYQLNPKDYNEEFTRDVLLKTMMVFPRNDYALAKYLIDGNRASSPELQRVMDIGALLESCNFSVFWRLIRNEYVPTDGQDEKFKNPDEVQRLLKPINGFEDAVRHYACRVITATFQTIEADQLIRLLGGISEAECRGYANLYKWEKRNDSTYFIKNHEATIKSRNVEERLKFEQCAEVLRTFT